MDHYSPRSYLVTPYYRPIAQMPNEKELCTQDTEGTLSEEKTGSTINPYLIHCLVTKLQVIYPNVYFNFLTIQLDNVMRGVFIITDIKTGEPLILKNDAYASVSGKFNQILKSSPTECLIYQANHQLQFVPYWYQEWMLDMINVPQQYNISYHRHPVSGQWGIYGDFSDYVSTDYTTNYTECLDTIQKEMILMYRSGYIKCHEKEADRLQLNKVVQISDGFWLCVPDWDFVSIRNSSTSPVYWLLHLIQHKKSYKD